MRKQPFLSVALICVLALLAGSTSLADARGRDLPLRYLPGSLDGRLERITNPLDGQEWATWAYRNGAEFDVAVAVRDEDGFWSEPFLFGVDDGVDQADPVLAVDSQGSLYLAFAERSPDQIMLSWLPVGSENWYEPVALTARGVRTSSPEIKVVGDRLVVAYRAGRGLVILDLPLVDPVIRPNIFNDGPDPVDARDRDATDPAPDDSDGPVYPFSDRDGGGGDQDPWDPPSTN